MNRAAEDVDVALSSLGGEFFERFVWRQSRLQQQRRQPGFAGDYSPSSASISTRRPSDR